MLRILKYDFLKLIPIDSNPMKKNSNNLYGQILHYI